MLAFDYLKENPRENAKLISTGWRELFTDPAVPYAVKQELLELQKLTPEITDSVLYFHGVFILDCLLGKCLSKEIFQDILTCRPWLDAAYSYLQSNINYKEQVTGFFRFLARNWSSTPDCLTMPEMMAVVDKCVKLPTYTNVEMAAVCLEVLRPGHARIDYTRCHIYGLFQFLDKSFLVKADTQTLKKAAELFRDVPMPGGSIPKYKSLNELERAHDERTAQEVKRMLSDKPRHYAYRTEFKDLIKQHGFTLPETKNDMIIRGAKHHNCVATYADRHFRYHDNYASTFTRLIFDKDATAELSIYHRHNKIVAVMVPQYKGRYNKDVEIPETLTDLCIALAGQPVSILKIMEVENEDDC
jgi:hypothetical protein